MQLSCADDFKSSYQSEKIDSHLKIVSIKGVLFVAPPFGDSCRNRRSPDGPECQSFFRNTKSATQDTTNREPIPSSSDSNLIGKRWTRILDLGTLHLYKDTISLGLYFLQIRDFKQLKIPITVKPRGRPSGSLNKNGCRKDIAFERSTCRNPSLFEHREREFSFSQQQPQSGIRGRPVQRAQYMLQP